MLCSDCFPLMCRNGNSTFIIDPGRDFTPGEGMYACLSSIEFFCQWVSLTAVRAGACSLFAAVPPFAVTMDSFGGLHDEVQCDSSRDWLLPWQTM